MFIIKKNYYFYIDNTELINLNSFLNSKKITIIYRNIKNLECIKKIIRFAQICKKKKN